MTRKEALKHCNTPIQRSLERPKEDWEPVELELVQDGYLARVSRTMKPGKWRWCAAPVDHVLKWNRNVTDVPFSKGFTGTRERAIEMAEAAIVALKKAGV